MSTSADTKKCPLCNGTGKITGTVPLKIETVQISGLEYSIRVGKAILAEYSYSPFSNIWKLQLLPENKIIFCTSKEEAEHYAQSLIKHYCRVIADNDNQ
jgi:hypothetical protein